MIETRRTCVLSMAHLTLATAQMLLDSPNESWPVHGGKMGPDMLTVHVGEADDREIPADLATCRAWARQPWENGVPKSPFDYIMFDRDVDPMEDGSGLPDLSEDPAPLPPFVPRDVTVGEFVILNNEGFGANNACEDVTIPAGQLWEVTAVHNYEAPQCRAVDLTHETGVTITVDDSDPEPIRFNFSRPPGPVYSINVRAMRQLTATVYIQAATEDEAELEAMRRAKKEGFSWDQSDPEDIQFESFN